jgi:hypothetical protein
MDGTVTSATVAAGSKKHLGSVQTERVVGTGD